MKKALAAVFVTGVVVVALGGRKNPVEGFADEQGNFVSDRAEVADKVVKASDWGTTPLGAPGTLVVDKTFKKKPVFQPKPVRKPGPTLIGGGKVVTVVAPTETERTLADEIAWHLKEMSGVDVPVAAEAPAKGPAVILRGAPDDGREGSEIRTTGDRVFLSGAGAGLSHAVTYFLEELGIRYLWPGRLGKVIPKRTTVVCPETQWTFAPSMRVRGVRGGPIGELSTWRDRNLKSTRAVGIDPEAYRQAVNARYYDRAGNRDFFEWHGVRDNPDCFGAANHPQAKYKWGHSFKWTHGKDFSREHPDFCALQPDGTREVKNGRWDRACFCLSNPDFVKRTIEETVKDFDRRVGKTAIAIGLPDGGGGCPCMCENCRKLDPPNAAARHYVFRRGEPTKYVELTDRVLWFFNQVVDGALKARPDRKGLTFFPYSVYLQPPVSVRPDPRLIALSVAGGYQNAANWNDARENVAAWINLGLETYWRPNLMWGWKTLGPQNFARRLFDDYETMKANGLKGTDFDCVGNDWGVKGLNVYVNCRVALNPDRLDYDTIFDDYCRAGFGSAAAEAKEYFDAVERMNAEAALAAAKRGILVKDFHQVALTECYLDSMDVDRLDAILGRATAKATAADEADVVARLGLLKAAVGYARRGKTLRRYASDETDEVRHRFRQAQRDYAAYARKMVLEEPQTCSPTGICLFDPYMYTFKAKKGKTK